VEAEGVEESQRRLAVREEMAVEESRKERREEVVIRLNMLRWGPQWAVLGLRLSRPEDPHQRHHPQQLQPSSPSDPGRNGQCPGRALQAARAEAQLDPVVSTHSGHLPAMMLAPKGLLWW
jgi:hypothetical protein